MRLTTKGRFAVTAMLDIAMHEAEKPVTLANISERQGISLSYLEQLFSRLRKRGLVNSIRGPGGGYKIAKAYDEITVAAIINAVNEQIDATQCGGSENCREHQRCMTHDLWTSLNNKILDYLSSVTLASMLADHAKKETRAVAFNQPNKSHEAQNISKSVNV